jgi:hypothetical protein
MEGNQMFFIFTPKKQKTSGGGGGGGGAKPEGSAKPAAPVLPIATETSGGGTPSQ